MLYTHATLTLHTKKTDENLCTYHYSQSDRYGVSEILRANTITVIFDWQIVRIAQETEDFIDE